MTAQKTRHTLGLAMIMKDEVEDLDRIVIDYGKFFDKIYVTVTDLKTYNLLNKRFPDDPMIARKLELSYFKWVDHFGKARNYNLRQVKTDYWMWIDLDDEIDGAQNIRKVVEYMDTNDINMIIFRYDYLRQDNLLDPNPVFWRERIIRTASNLKWTDEAVHENINFLDDNKHVILPEVVIKHRKTAEQVSISLKRNSLILEKDWQKTKNALTAWYIGTTLREMGDYEGAIEKLLFVTEHSLSRVYRFAAWQGLCDCYYHIGKYQTALDAVTQCMAIDPDNPGGWYQGFLVFRAMGYYDLAMESAESAMTKHADKELAIILGEDPSWQQYRTPFEIAQTYLSIGNVERAYELYQQVIKIAPEYIKEINETSGTQWDTVFEEAHDNKIAKS